MALKKETVKEVSLTDKIALLDISVRTLAAGAENSNELTVEHMEAANKVMAKVWPDIKTALGLDDD